MPVKREPTVTAMEKNIEIIRKAVADLGPGVAYMTSNELEGMLDPCSKWQSSLALVDAALGSHKGDIKPVTGVCVLEIDYAEFRFGASPAQLTGLTDPDCNGFGGELRCHRGPNEVPYITFHSSKLNLPCLVTLRAGDDYVVRSLAVSGYVLPTLEVHDKYKISISPLPFKSVQYELVPYFNRLLTAMHEAHVRRISDVLDFEEAHLKLVREQERVKKLTTDLAAEKLRSARLDKNLTAVLKKLNDLRAGIFYFLRKCRDATKELREANQDAEP